MGGIGCGSRGLRDSHGQQKIDIGDIAAVITAGASVVYGLGLLAVAWSIYARITHDPRVTLRAVALIPKTVVAGEGLRIVLKLPLVATVQWLVFLLLANTIDVVFRELSGSRMHYLDTLYTPVVVVFLVLWGAMVFTLARSPTTAWLFNLELANRISPFLLLVSVGLATLCMYEIAALWSRSPHIVNVTKAGFPPLITVNPDPVVPFIILMFTSAFFFGLPYAAAANPPLPTVSVTTKDRPPQCFTANLVAHTDGFWHLFDEQRDDQPRYLLSIPDDRVCKAEMQPKGQR